MEKTKSAMGARHPLPGHVLLPPLAKPQLICRRVTTFHHTRRVLCTDGYETDSPQFRARSRVTGISDVRLFPHWRSLVYWGFGVDLSIPAPREEIDSCGLTKKLSRYGKSNHRIEKVSNDLLSIKTTRALLCYSYNCRHSKTTKISTSSFNQATENTRWLLVVTPNQVYANATGQWGSHASHPEREREEHLVKIGIIIPWIHTSRPVGLAVNPTQR